MDNLIQDLRYTFRTIGRQPVFASIIVLTLALGLGGNTAIFSVVRGVLLRPLPYDNAGRVIAIWGSNPGRGWLRFGASLQDFEDWRGESRSIQQMAAWWTGRANLTGGDRPERVNYALVSPSLFAVLGTAPALGRPLRSEENEPGAGNVVVVSHDFWRRALGGVPNALGSNVFLDGEALEVVGVMPRGFAFPDASVDLWKPFGERPEEFGRRGARWVGVVGALAPDRQLEGARAELEAVAGRLDEAYPDTNSGWTVFLEPFHASLVEDARPVLLVAWIAVGIVLLIVCANLANLLLARATRRERELAVRGALGAERRRLIRQMLTESLFLAGCGGVLGLVLARLGLSAVRALAPPGLPGAESIGIDAAVLAYSIALILITGVLFGALPAFRGSDVDLAPALKTGARGSLGGRHRRLRGGLVIAELALATMVLVGAGLLMRSFERLLSVDPGFEVEGRLSLRVAPTMDAYPERNQAVAFYEELLVRLDGLPGVSAVGTVNVLPVSGSWWTSSIWIEGREAPPDQRPVVNARVISGDYLAAIGIPLLRGRGFRSSDNHLGAPVVLIDESAARSFWPGEDPIGKRIAFGDPTSPGVRRFTVVGIVGKVRHNTLTVAATPMAYMPLAQAQFGNFRDWGMSVVMRTAGRPTAIVAAARRVVGELDPTLPVFDAATLEAHIADDLAERRFTLTLVSIFAAVAMILAALGVYGVLSYVVAERTREIAMRIALGADRSRILAWVLRGGMLLAAAGLLVGIGLSAATSRFLSTLLYEVSAKDPITFVGIALTLSIVAFAACLVPALRATRVDPMVALRDPG